MQNNRINDKLYHGSPEVVRNPEIIPLNRGMDFGYGFYCTTSESQARKWARNKIAKKRLTEGYINIYAFEKQEEELIIKDFGTKPTIEWLDFVVENRTNPKYEFDYDIIIGPVADDEAYQEIERYITEKDFSTEKKVRLIKTLKTETLKDQIVFHTSKALKIIKFDSFKEVRPLKKIEKNPKTKKGKRL